MGKAFALALGDVLTPAGRRALLQSLAGAFILLALLWLGAWALLDLVHIARFPWLDWPIRILGDLAALFLAWLIFPSMSMLVLGLFLDRVLAALEAAHYPGQPPARAVGIGEAILSGLKLALLGCPASLGEYSAVSEPPDHSCWPRSIALPRRFSRRLAGSSETTERSAPARK